VLAVPVNSGREGAGEDSHRASGGDAEHGAIHVGDKRGVKRVGAQVNGGNAGARLTGDSLILAASLSGPWGDTLDSDVLAFHDGDDVVPCAIVVGSDPVDASACDADAPCLLRCGLCLPPGTDDGALQFSRVDGGRSDARCIDVVALPPLVELEQLELFAGRAPNPERATLVLRGQRDGALGGAVEVDFFADSEENGVVTTDERGGVSASVVIIEDDDNASGGAFVVAARVAVPDGANRLVARLLSDNGRASDGLTLTFTLPLSGAVVDQACVAGGGVDSCVVGAQCVAGFCAAVDGDAPDVIDVGVSAVAGDDAFAGDCAALEAA